MSKVLTAIRKRQKWPVSLGEDTIYIRAMIKREQRESLEVAEVELRAYYIFGTVILGDDDTPLFARLPGESATEYAKRVDLEMEDVPEDHKVAILNALNKAHAGNQDTIVKNS